MLDCFAGTGGFGIEAVSRGAVHCSFIEKEPSVLLQNLKLLNKDTYSLFRGDFFKAVLKLDKKFDIIFIDPPYGKYTTAEITKAVYEQDILANDGVLIYEESVRTHFEFNTEHFELETEKKYGDTKLYYLRITK